MDIKQSQAAKKYLDLFLRRKLFIIFLLLLSLPVGLGVYLKTPKEYQATSLLSYQRQKISPNSMSPDSSGRISDIVSTLTQIVMSRNNLEETILSLNLYPEARKKLPIEDVIESMRKKIDIRPMRKGDIFTVSFSGTLPGSVVKVANGIAAKFIEENLKYRQERASETSSYTSDELEMAKKGMDQKENAMRDYKLKYYYEMPEQRPTNVARLIGLQDQYQKIQVNIQELERTLVLVQEQVSSRKKSIASTPDFSAGFEFDFSEIDAEDIEAVSGNVPFLADMKLRLEQLLLRYTEKHPEVKRTLKIIARLEKEASLESDDGPSPTLAENDIGEFDIGEISMKNVDVDAILLQLDAQRTNIELNIANFRKDQENLKKQIEQYEGWVSSSPTREAEWTSLTREYGQLKRHYDHLVSQDLQAKSMLNMERKQKGSQFKIEDPARYPSKPIKPDFFKILGAAIAVGLGLGFGLPILVDFLDTTFRDDDGAASYLGLPLISTIPYIETDKEVKNRKRYAVFSTGFLVCFSLVILALFFYLWRKGLIVT
jgi:polysaccharide chain length determinant protein (PEP-CTERM system associated)